MTWFINKNKFSDENDLDPLSLALVKSIFPKSEKVQMEFQQNSLVSPLGQAKQSDIKIIPWAGKW